MKHSIGTKSIAQNYRNKLQETTIGHNNRKSYGNTSLNLEKGQIQGNNYIVSSFSEGTPDYNHNDNVFIMQHKKHNIRKLQEHNYRKTIGKHIQENYMKNRLQEQQLLHTTIGTNYRKQLQEITIGNNNRKTVGKTLLNSDKGQLQESNYIVSSFSEGTQASSMPRPIVLPSWALVRIQ